MPDSNESWTFWTDFQKYSDVEFNGNPVGADLFYADRRTDMTKLIVAFRNFANAPVNEHVEVPPQFKRHGQ